eukprot:SAG31_NODE_1387_length_8554_cov_14.239148_2_plen_94_part_00
MLNCHYWHAAVTRAVLASTPGAWGQRAAARRTDRVEPTLPTCEAPATNTRRAAVLNLVPGKFSIPCLVLNLGSGSTEGTSYEHNLTKFRIRNT